MIAVRGNTYPVKDKIKAIGGIWRADAKVWMVPASKAREARMIMDNSPMQTKLQRERGTASSQVDAHGNRIITQLCPVCDSYCYGDCEAN